MDVPLIIERIEIRKYDGDLPRPGEDKAPVEIVIIDHRGEDICPSPDSASGR
jgi:hypothetical protein